MIQRFSLNFFDLYYFQVEMYGEFVSYETESSAWRDILAFFCGGYRDRYGKCYYFPSEQSAIHFGMLIGESDSWECTYYGRFFFYHYQMDEARREMRAYGDLIPF